MMDYTDDIALKEMKNGCKKAFAWIYENIITDYASMQKNIWASLLRILFMMFLPSY